MDHNCVNISGAQGHKESSWKKMGTGPIRVVGGGSKKEDKGKTIRAGLMAGRSAGRSRAVRWSVQSGIEAIRRRAVGRENGVRLANLENQVQAVTIRCGGTERPVTVSEHVNETTLDDDSGGCKRGQNSKGVKGNTEAEKTALLFCGWSDWIGGAVL